MLSPFHPEKSYRSIANKVVVGVRLEQRHGAIVSNASLKVSRFRLNTALDRYRFPVGSSSC
jgi:hypothetical protein